VEEVVLKPSAAAIEQQVSTVQQLADAASKHPFYKYNGIWQRDIQNLITSLQIRTWLETKELITIEQVGSVLKGKQEQIPTDLYENADCLPSTRQPQRPRCLSSHNRGLPPGPDEYNRRACSSSPKFCYAWRLRPTTPDQQVHQRHTRWVSTAQFEERCTPQAE
jgi:Translin family